jgi:hypothetical protein
MARWNNPVGLFFFRHLSRSLRRVGGNLIGVAHGRLGLATSAPTLASVAVIVDCSSAGRQINSP